MDTFYYSLKGKHIYMAKQPEQNQKTNYKLENIFITHHKEKIYFIKSLKEKTTQQKKIGKVYKQLIKKKLQISIRKRKLQ